MLDVRDAGAAVRREWAAFAARLASLPCEGWDGPLRLPGWRVRDLVAHTVWGASLEADGLSRRRTGAPGPAEGIVVRPDAAPAELAAALADATRSLVEEVDLLVGQEAVDRPVPMPYADVPLAVALQVFVMEAGVHGADLAAAAGDEVALAPDVVDAAVETLRVFLPSFAAGGRGHPGDGAVVALRSPGYHLRLRRIGGTWAVGDWHGAGATTTAADDDALVLFALGRLDPEDPRLAHDGGGAGFKRWFPGP